MMTKEAIKDALKQCETLMSSWISEKNRKYPDGYDLSNAERWEYETGQAIINLLKTQLEKYK